MSKFLKPIGKDLFEGLDVSEFQGEIDWKKVYEAGKRAAYVRSSVGDDYIDARFEENYKGARTSGFKVGFYHYVTAVNVSQAKEEARFFVAVIRGKPFEMRPAMDFEYFGDLSERAVNEIGKAFLDEVVERSGKKAAIYSDASNARTVWNDAIAKNYPLWIADWDAAGPEYTDAWEGWTGWQYTDSGVVDGIQSNGTDLDRYTDLILLPDYSPVCGKPAKRPSSGRRLIKITVKKGYTLTSIAQKYGTDVESIVKLNDIKNPDLIYVGQRLYVYDRAGSGEKREDYYTVRGGDALWTVANKFSTNVRRLAGINRLRNPDLIFPGQKIKLGFYD